MLKIDQRIVMVIRKTRQEELTAKFGTKGQAQFYVARARAAQASSQMKAAVAAAAPAQAAKLLAKAEEDAELGALQELGRVEDESRGYHDIVKELRRELDFEIPVQVVDRTLVPNMIFGPHDVIVVVGQDGLVANVAKYALGLPIVGVNPNPQQYDGILLPFEFRQARSAVQRALEGRAKVREVTLAQATLNDGQRLLAFNDLFIGARSHVSARYRVMAEDRSENQSSSGMIVSTGAGSTGWFSSVMNMVSGVVTGFGGTTAQRTSAAPAVRLRWEDRKLVYVVREPFVSKTTQATLVAGMLSEGEHLTVESAMAGEGTIFSDGVESDGLDFGEGAIATIGLAKERARLVIP